MKARVIVTLKAGVLDPQGKAIDGALRGLGIEGVASVRQGKVFDVEVHGGDGARSALEAAAKRLLANPVIEDYDVQLSEAPVSEIGPDEPAASDVAVEEISQEAAAQEAVTPETPAQEAVAQEAAAHAAMPPEGHP